MCEECEDAEPFYVAYFGKAGGDLWRPPQAEPVQDDRRRAPVARARFACDDLHATKEPSSIQRKAG